VNLFLYIRIGGSQLDLPPAWVNRENIANFSLFDVDDRSGPEVIQVASEAVYRSQAGVVAIDIRDSRVEVNSLFKLLKSILKKGNQFNTFMTGTHPQVHKLLSRSGSFSQVHDKAELEEKILSFFEQN